MIVRPGDFAVVSRGRKTHVVHVTDAVDQTAPEVVAHPDDIAMGNIVEYMDGVRVETGAFMVFAMGEVTSIVQ